MKVTKTMTQKKAMIRVFRLLSTGALRALDGYGAARVIRTRPEHYTPPMADQVAIRGDWRTAYEAIHRAAEAAPAEAVVARR